MIRQAVVLCGGLGTRTGALTAQTPKPLLRVGDIHFLDVLLFELGRHGLRRILLLAGFAADRVLEYVTATPMKTQFGLEIEVMIEPRRAGTGGAVWHARDRLDDTFLLLNGDSWFDINLLELAARTVRDPSATAGIALRFLSTMPHVSVLLKSRARGSPSFTAVRITREAASSMAGSTSVAASFLITFGHLARSRRTHFRALLVTES